MIAREVKRLGNKIAYKREMIKSYTEEIPALERRRDELLGRLADDLGDDGAGADG